MKKAIEVKTTKTGRKSYYVDGKRVSRDKAIEIAAEQREGNLFTVMAERRFELADGTVEIRVNEAECKKLETRIGRYMYERDIEVNGEFIIKVYSDDDARAIVDRITEAYLAGYSGCKINVDGTFTVIESEANPADYAITNAAFREAVTGEVKAAYAAKLATEREEIMSTPLTTPEALDAAVEAETESELAEIQRDLAEPITEATITPTLDDLKKNSRLYAVSGKALAALAFGINAPIDCDDETADQYEQAFQAVKTARDKFNESRKNFIKQYDQTEANIKARAKKRLSKVSTQVLDMLQNIPTAAAIALKFMPSTPRNFTFDTERFGLDSYTAENKVVKIGEDTIEYDANGKIEWVVSDKYGALLQFLPSGEIAYFTKPLRDDGKSFYNELDRWCVNDFFLNLAERGACIIGDPKPTDDFASKLAELESKEAEARAAVEKAKVALLAAQNVRDEAEAEYRKARKEISRLLNMTASKLTEKIWELSLDAMTLNNQDGKSFKAQHGGTVTPHIEHTFKISNGWKVCGYYDTPAQVTCVIEMLTAAVNTGKTEFTFPTIDELNQANFTADSLKEVTV
ncbi:MAG: hypothetical protein IJG33_16975 [Selenomonadaceae bacterium]|nr:hypothetical protein [Selenomonadaceae bacterium]